MWQWLQSWSTCAHDYVLSWLLLDNTVLDLSAGKYVKNTIKAVKDITFPTLDEITQEQNTDVTLQQFFNWSSDHCCVRIVNNTKLLVYDVKHLIIFDTLQQGIIAWCCHYLQHSRHISLQETLKATMYWRTMHSNIHNHVRRCSNYQHDKQQWNKFGKYPAK